MKERKEVAIGEKEEERKKVGRNRDNWFKEIKTAKKDFYFSPQNLLRLFTVAPSTEFFFSLAS